MPHTLFASPLVYAAACAVLLVAQAVYVLFGFGAGLIAVGTLALFMPGLQDVVVLLLLVNLPAELSVAWQSRRRIRWRPIATLGSGIAVGIPLGAWLLRVGEPGIVLKVLGGFLVAVGLLFLRLPAGGGRQPPAWAAPPTGLLSGVLTGLFGTGGPPLIVWYHLSAPDKTAFRGNLMTLFLLMTCVRVPSYAAAGLLDGVRLGSALAVLPAALLGGWLGHRLHLQIPETVFRRLVAGLLVVLGGMQLLG